MRNLKSPLQILLVIITVLSLITTIVTINMAITTAKKKGTHITNLVRRNVKLGLENLDLRQSLETCRMIISHPRSEEPEKPNSSKL